MDVPFFVLDVHCLVVSCFPIDLGCLVIFRTVSQRIFEDFML